MKATHIEIGLRISVRDAIVKQPRISKFSSTDPTWVRPWSTEADVSNNPDRDKFQAHVSIDDSAQTYTGESWKLLQRSKKNVFVYGEIKSTETDIPKTFCYALTDNSYIRQANSTEDYPDAGSLVKDSGHYKNCGKNPN